MGDARIIVVNEGGSMAIGITPNNDRSPLLFSDTIPNTEVGH
jgi:hypothetical protein